ncbi:MAG: DUF3450 domain-containing protein [Thermodesulfobacteriota bacterium]
MILKRMIAAGIIGLVICCWSPEGMAEDFAARLQAPIDQAIDTRISTQKEMDLWEQERIRLTERYDQLQREQADLTDRLTQLQKEIADRQSLALSLETQINEARAMAAEIEPFLASVYPRIRQEVEADLPFLSAERKDRLDHLKQVLDDPEVSVSEKFRKTMETLLVEAAYGNTSDVYQEQLRLEGDERMFSVLRVGRVALFCLSPDQNLAGYYSVAEGTWRPLPGRWCRDLQAAIDMAEKRRPADLVKLPLGKLAGREGNPHE